jgi:hypothetical protein
LSDTQGNIFKKPLIVEGFSEVFCGEIVQSKLSVIS